MRYNYFAILIALVALYGAYDVVTTLLDWPLPNNELKILLVLKTIGMFALLGFAYKLKDKTSQKS